VTPRCSLGVLHVLRWGKHQTLHAGVHALLDHPTGCARGVRRNPDYRPPRRVAGCPSRQSFWFSSTCREGTRGVKHKTSCSISIDGRSRSAQKCHGQVIQIAVRDRAGAKTGLPCSRGRYLVVEIFQPCFFPLKVSAGAAAPSTISFSYWRPPAGVIHPWYQSLPTSRADRLSDEIISAAIGHDREEANPLPFIHHSTGPLAVRRLPTDAPAGVATCPVRFRTGRRLKGRNRRWAIADPNSLAYG